MRNVHTGCRLPIWLCSAVMHKSKRRCLTRWERNLLNATIGISLACKHWRDTIFEVLHTHGAFCVPSRAPLLTYIHMLLYIYIFVCVTQSRSACGLIILHVNIAHIKCACSELWLALFTRAYWTCENWNLYFINMVYIWIQHNSYTKRVRRFRLVAALCVIYINISLYTLLFAKCALATPIGICCWLHTTPYRKSMWNNINMNLYIPLSIHERQRERVQFMRFGY